MSNIHNELASVMQWPVERLIFVDGILDSTLSNYTFPQGVELETKSGVTLNIADNVQLSKPVYIAWLNQDGTKSGYQGSVGLNIGQNSQLTLVEHFIGEDGRIEYNADFSLGRDSHLFHYRLQCETAQAVHEGKLKLTLNQGSELDALHLTLGSQKKSLDLDVELVGEYAHSRIYGAYLLNGQTNVAYKTLTNHLVPNCKSDEVFRGIIQEQATANFVGRIYIEKDAQKTEAMLSNKNLLTSDQAKVHTKPELEIYADDVKCAHGATVAQLDDEALFYLKTRGLDEVSAAAMISYSFIAEILGAVEHPVISPLIGDYVDTFLHRERIIFDELDEM